MITFTNHKYRVINPARYSPRQLTAITKNPQSTGKYLAHNIDKSLPIVLTAFGVINKSYLSQGQPLYGANRGNSHFISMRLPRVEFERFFTCILTGLGIPATTITSLVVRDQSVVFATLKEPQSQSAPPSACIISS